MTRELGDILGEAISGTTPAPEPFDGFDILGVLASRHGLEMSQLVDELQGDTGLAKIARSLLGLESLARSKRKRGRPRSDLSWEQFDFALRMRVVEPRISNEEIARRWVEKTGGENDRISRASSLVKQLSRLDKRWGDKSTLELLMLDSPPDRTRT